ncbi:alpha/beta hydrolase [uncultured Microbulbifer sp.]|uniref:alpha/beta fold hydrolase n=1 Tax=uncultured Microbulbifer sp. TaxID=348147 RepID=UPI0026335EDA|nr:alpha/beta hydrolase [uncultured Microbulbifer sp.]
MNVHEFGDSGGVPVVLFTGTPQKGDSGQEFSNLAIQFGIRLICPTRPWYDEFDSAPSFSKCTDKTRAYLEKNKINICHVIGGSGGGPFAIHFSTTYFDVVHSCYLLASMGTPSIFVEKVKSPPTLKLLEFFRNNSYRSAIDYLTSLGLSEELAHGAWSDFKVLLGSWESIEFQRSPVVYIHHGEEDENAPIESIRDLAGKLPRSEIRVSPQASHIELAEDKELSEFNRIFKEIAAHRGTAS